MPRKGGGFSRAGPRPSSHPAAVPIEGLNINTDSLRGKKPTRAENEKSAWDSARVRAPSGYTLPRLDDLRRRWRVQITGDRVKDGITSCQAGYCGYVFAPAAPEPGRGAAAADGEATHRGIRAPAAEGGPLRHCAAAAGGGPNPGQSAGIQALGNRARPPDRAGRRRHPYRPADARAAVHGVHADPPQGVV